MSATIKIKQPVMPVTKVQSVVALGFALLFLPPFFYDLSEISLTLIQYWIIFIAPGSGISLAIIWYIGLSHMYEVELFDDHILIKGTDIVFAIRYHSDNRSTIEKFKSMISPDKKLIRLIDIKSLRRNNLDTADCQLKSNFIEIETNKGMTFSIPYNSDKHEDTFIHELIQRYKEHIRKFTGDNPDDRIIQHPKFFPFFNINYGNEGSYDNFPWFGNYVLISIFIWAFGFFLISGVISLLIYSLTAIGIFWNFIGLTLIVAVTLLFSVFLSYYFRSIPINPKRVKFV